MCAGETHVDHEDTHFPCCTFGPKKFNQPGDDEISERERNDQCRPTFLQWNDPLDILDIQNSSGIAPMRDSARARLTDSSRAQFVDNTRTHVWLWCVPGMIFFVAWITLLQYLQQALAEAGNRQNINVSQYAVLVSNVGGVNIEDDRLKDFGRYYGDVVAAFHVRNYGRYLTKNLEVCCASCAPVC